MENKIFIFDIDKKYNTELLPIIINDNEIINYEIRYEDNKFLRSQYSLELVLKNIFSKYKNVTSYEESDIVYIPIFLFCLAWQTKYFYDVKKIINAINDINYLLEKFIKDNKKIIMVYSDVMWDDERCFINHFKFNENIFFICYESSGKSNQIVVPYVTHIKNDIKNYKIPANSKKNNLISYVGRFRKEINYFENIVFKNTNLIQSDKWISINDIDLYNEIDNLYLDSFYSLQPHGDRKTRKGFYHSLLMGSIPVIFEDNYDEYQKVFKDTINIEDISIILKLNEKERYNEILLNNIKTIPKKIETIESIKNLLLYDDNNFDIIDLILKRINYI